jgi:hypothetical protein
MQKNATSLQKKLKSYSLMAGTMLTISSVAEAQILHQNIADTTFIDNETGLSFDMNNDGITDFTFFLIKSGTAPSVNQFVDGFASAVDNEIAGSVGSNSYVYPLALQAGDKIGADLEWQAYGSLFWVFGQHYSSGGGTPVQFGNWLGQQDKYAGLRIEVAEQKYYGWLRMSVDSFANEFTITEYALQSIPDSAIMAGDTDFISGVPNAIIENKIKILAFEKDVFVTVPSGSQHDLEIYVMNMLGGVVKRIQTKERQVHLRLTDLPDGIYLVTAELDGIRKAQKISIR